MQKEYSEQREKRIAIQRTRFDQRQAQNHNAVDLMKNAFKNRGAGHVSDYFEAVLLSDDEDRHRKIPISEKPWNQGFFRFFVERFLPAGQSAWLQYGSQEVAG